MARFYCNQSNLGTMSRSDILETRARTEEVEEVLGFEEGEEQVEE